MSQDTEKIKPIPNNRTLKKRCPVGEHRNPITGLCEPVAPKKTGNKTVLGCSSTYEPKNDNEIARMNELNKLTIQALRDMLATLTGEPSGKTYFAGARLKSEIISLIICIENIQATPTPAAETIEEPAPEVKVPIAEPIVEPEMTENESIYLDEPVTEDIDVTISDTNVKIQNEIGNAPFDMDSKEGNEFLFNKELLEHNSSFSGDNSDFLYPELNDPDFNIKIAKRKEFYDTLYDGKIRDIKTHANLLCGADFELMPHQMFVKNFLSFQTPYNALLLYHGLGTGKTCSAIGIAEEMRGFMKQIGLTQRILVVASPNVQNNFRLQLFDERKLEPDGDLWSLNTCIGNSLLKEINPTSMRGIPREKVISQINSIINKYYSFVGYTELAHFIQRKVLAFDDTQYSAKDRKELKIKRIRKFFDNRLIIIDEVHNIRPTDDNKDKTRTASLLMEICKYAENIRLLLLSATPLYNSYKEIIWLTNILNCVDKRSAITESMVFDKNGDFLPERTDNKGKLLENGRELLRRKLTGYVSYVRGENPYTFPYRIYPNIFSPENTLNIDNYPKIQMNKKTIEDPLAHIPVYMTNMNEYQSKGYLFIMEYLRNRSSTVVDKFGQTKTMPTFENMETFGYTYLEKPLQSLDIVYPSVELDTIMNSTSMDDTYLETLVQNMVGKNGLSKVMTHKTSDVLNYDYEYNSITLQKYGRIFNAENLHKYSSKLAAICKCILNSTGIVIVYSQYIDGGVVPMALALEEMGFSRYGSAKYTKSLFKSPPTEPLHSRTMKPKSQLSSEELASFKPAKYVMITGDKRFSPNNNEDMKYITNSENVHGENVKVILITKAAAEGLDFKNIRQIHIMEPWYNMNRVEQIIGRGVRNLSHCALPFEQRNVELYLHATTPPNEEETADMYIYRFAEKKAKQIGTITRILKETAVDCILNIGQTNFTIEKLLEQDTNKNIKIELSSKKGVEVEYQIGDHAFTDLCDYMDNCSFTCSPNASIEPSDVIADTYNDEYARINYSMIVKRIRQLFKEKVFYNRIELINSINIKYNLPPNQRIKHVASNYPNENIDYSYNETQIDFVLSRFVNNKHEHLIDKYGRLGYLTNLGDIYAFQPIEITDPYATIFERTIPVDYKPTKLQLELPLKQKVKPKTDVQITTELNKISNTRTYTDVLKEITDNMKNAIILSNLETGEVDWFKHLGNVTHKLKLFHTFLTDDLITKYAIQHAIDTLPLNDKLLIVQYLYNKNTTSLLNIETQIKAYFDMKLLRNGSQTGIILIYENDENTTFKIYVQDQTNSGVWNEINALEYGNFKTSLTQFISNINTYNDIIGFMSVFKNNKVVFKTKNMTDKRNNKGAYCENAGKRDIIARLNEVIGSTVYNEDDLNKDIEMNGVKMPNIIFKNGLCVMMEILMRYYDDAKRLNKKWFFNPENALLNRILETKK
jgi:hypothetical protein